jgi:hypothetical protein
MRSWRPPANTKKRHSLPMGQKNTEIVHHQAPIEHLRVSTHPCIALRSVDFAGKGMQLYMDRLGTCDFHAALCCSALYGFIHFFTLASSSWSHIFSAAFLMDPTLNPNVSCDGQAATTLYCAIWSLHEVNRTIEGHHKLFHMVKRDDDLILIARLLSAKAKMNSEYNKESKIVVLLV